MLLFAFGKKKLQLIYLFKPYDMTRLYVVVLCALMPLSTVIGLECYRWTSNDYEILYKGGWKKEDARRLCKEYNYVFAPDESRSDQKCGSCWCCKPKPLTVFSYNCKEGCCISYGEDIIGTSKDVAKACSKDHPKCKAYSYSVGKETGHLCKFSNVYSRCRSRDYKACYKYPDYQTAMVASDGNYALITAIGSIDFDSDGIPDQFDNDDDNDGIPDDEDNDDDNDGIPDTRDKDDDNDGFPDWMDVDIMSDGDLDDDGIPDWEDIDDDNDSIPDYLDSDDDNDGIPDFLDDHYSNDDEEVPNMDTDGDYIPNIDDPDIDGDGILNVDDEDYSEYNSNDKYNWQNWLIVLNECKNKTCGESCSEGVCDGDGFCIRSEFNPCAVNGCDGKKCGTKIQLNKDGKTERIF